MELCLVRHAAAIDRTVDIPEEMRYLVPEGRALFRKTARTMLKRGLEPNLILSSPLVRAVQTAEILAESLEYNGPLVVTNELSPGLDLAGLERILQYYKPVGELVLVGHEPDLGNIAAALMGLQEGFDFKKGAAVMMKINPDKLQAKAGFKWQAVGKKLKTSYESLPAKKS
jgi:phosphohistidine phosphatase